MTAVRQLVSAPGLAASLDLSAWAPKAPSRLSLDHTWRRSMMLVSHSVSQSVKVSLAFGGSPRATPLAPRRLAAVLRGSEPSILDLFLVM